MFNCKRQYLLLAIILVIISFLIFFYQNHQGEKRSGNQEKRNQNSSSATTSSRRIFTPLDENSHSTRVEIEQEITIEGMPLEIDQWEISATDRNIFTKLSDDLLEREISRIIDESHSYIEQTITDELRGLLGVGKGINSVENLHVTTALRPPDPQELQEIYAELNEALGKSSVSAIEKVKIRKFFEDRFSLKDQRYKILDTNAKKLSEDGKVSRLNFVILCSEFIAEGEEGKKQIIYKGAFEGEETYTNPHTRVSKRYDHLIDTEAGE